MKQKDILKAKIKLWEMVMKDEKIAGFIECGDEESAKKLLRELIRFVEATERGAKQ